MKARRHVEFLILAALFLSAAVPTAASEPASARVDRAEKCSLEDEVSSFRLGVAGITDDGSTVRLDVLVLRHGVTRRIAAEVMADVDKMYRPLDIALAVQYRSLPGPVPDAIRDLELIQLSKDAVGGARPSGIDVV